MVKNKKKFLLVFLFSILFNIFHDYVFIALEDNNVEVILLQDLEHCSDKNIDIHKVLHSPFLVLNNSLKLENTKDVQKNILSQNISLKLIKKEIFKPPINF